MTTSSFEFTVRRIQDVAVLDLQGDINGAASGALEAAYTEASVMTPAALVLNFEAVDYINSTGIALIVGLLARARTTGLQVMACGLAAHYQEIFTITRLSDFMAIFPDEDSALADRPALTQ